MKRILLLLLLGLAACTQRSVLEEAAIEGPYLILSTPYYEDGSVNYDNLVREARFAAEWNTPGLIWPQSNDSVDLLTEEERIEGMRRLVEEWREHPKRTRLVLGVNGDDTAQMLRFARTAEDLAQESGVPLILAARPPYYGTDEEMMSEYYDSLASVTDRPVIIQTYVNDACPSPSVEFLIDLARRYPDSYGWIKEESDKLEANDRQRAEIEGKPYVKTVFSAWGGWQWLYQHRRNGTMGLISEKVAYAPLTSLVWELMKSGDEPELLTEAFAMYRLMIDQRFVVHDSLRGYALHYLVRLGIFDNMLSRTYALAPDGPDGTYSPENKGKWVLDEYVLTESQTAELDLCYDDMMRFVNKYYKR